MTLIQRLGALGDRDGDDESTMLQHRFLIYMAVLMSGGGLLWGTLCVVFSLGLTALIPFGYTILTVFNLLYFKAYKRFERVRWFQVLISLVLPFAFQWSLGGFEVSGAVMLWGMLALVGSLTFSETKSSVRWLIMYVALTVLSGILDATVKARFAVDVADDVRTAFFVVNIAVISFVVFRLTLYLLAKQREEAEERRRELAQRNTDLEEDLSQARRMGSYHLVRKLGEGGMGEVWLAEHRLLARPAAVKLIRPKMLAADPERAERLMRRFEREAQATASLRSPHTIEVYDFGRTEDGAFYYVMELLDGLSLEELVEQFGPLSPGRAAHLLGQACDSLADAHAEGLIHRDVKPANIFVGRYGRFFDYINVLDFGLVKAAMTDDSESDKLTQQDSLPGTPAFISPEGVSTPSRVDGRSDIYSLGCVAYWLLSGVTVFESETPIHALIQHAKDPVAPISERVEHSIPPELEALIMACLEKDPQQRPQSAAELGEQFKAIAAALGWTPTRSAEWWAKHVPRQEMPEASKSERWRAAFVGNVSQT